MVSTQLPGLSKPQAPVLGRLSLGMAVAHNCARSAVNLLLAAWEDRTPNTVHQQLRAWRYDAPDQRGSKRRELDSTHGVAPLLCWVLAGYGGKQRALALSVVARGCASPVAWKVVLRRKPVPAGLGAYPGGAAQGGAAAVRGVLPWTLA